MASASDLISRIDSSLGDLQGMVKAMATNIYFRFRSQLHHICADKLEKWFHIVRTFFSDADDHGQFDDVDDLDIDFQSLGEQISHFLEWDVNVKTLEELMKALEEQILFLENLRLFAFKSAEPESNTADEDFLIHLGAVSVNVAFLNLRCQSENIPEKSFSEQVLLFVSQLVEYIKPIHPRVYNASPAILRSSKSNLSEMLLLLESEDVVSGNDQLRGVVSSMKDQLQELYQGLGSLTTILSHKPTNDFDLNAKDRFFDVVCDAGILICSLYQTQIQLGFFDVVCDAGILICSLYQTQIQIGHDLRHLLEAIRRIIAEFGKKAASGLDFEVQKLEAKMKGVTMAHHHHHVPSQRTLSSDNEVVGYVEEAELIKNQLTGGSKQVRIVSIVGMPGQGKTTLAGRVYNDPSILLHFSARAWTSVSQVVDKSRVLLDLLGQIDPDKCSGIIFYHDLVQKVWRSLKGKKYLIFLDDIWEAEAWSSLKEAFPEDHTASRIMFTSRHHDVAPSEEAHELRAFSEEESMDLLQRKLFGGSSWPDELVNLGRKIAQICKGLPLTILIVAGILATVKPNGWKKILRGLGSGTVSSTEQCRNTLELSYSHLPEHLRPCLLYLATFPEDKEVSVKRLFQLWIAEGLVQKDETEHFEDVAEEYLKHLVGRSLISVAKQKSTGGVKACRIHDLLHEFCLHKAKDEWFFSILPDMGKVLEFHAPDCLRRLCINSDPKHLRMSNTSLQSARSLNFNYYVQRVLPNLTFMFHMCKLLKVLDLKQLNLGLVFPSEIGLLVQLSFLAIRGCMPDIPLSIGKLSNLETFILNHLAENKTVSLPDSFWNLQKLRYFYMTCQGGVFPMENTANSSDLCELDWLSGIAIPCHPHDMERLLLKFPNIRKLKCTLLKSPNMLINHVKIVVPQILCLLESVSLSLSYDGVTHSEFSLPANLKKLTLSNFPLSSSSLSTFSSLSNLEVLKFEDVHFKGNTWEMEEAEFSKLRILQLSSWCLLSWTASDDQFDRLEKLVLVRCGSLKEVPSCLDYIPTLEVIELRYCSKKVMELVGNIKEAQENYRNSELKIINVKLG
ncbi:OLC1v1007818C1 [Oldenlandia corymbosa var. corymbosa]|uniref:OLC1v1007818C1 n=1 Tax=Oldenlandia corymbosa var. corymbosa TaxID=529605 RepID=A0AAV1DMK1_OLDCO|nr:OLC1v1007818C1 [Oldenlandia corymbosa var. corymbosa]